MVSVQVKEDQWQQTKQQQCSCKVNTNIAHLVPDMIEGMDHYDTSYRLLYHVVCAKAFYYYSVHSYSDLSLALKLIVCSVWFLNSSFLEPGRAFLMLTRPHVCANTFSLQLTRTLQIFFSAGSCKFNIHY